MKTIGICSDHAGFELKEYVRGWLEAKGWAYKDFGPTQPRVATIPTLHILWHWPLKPESAIRELPSAEAVKVSA